MLQPIDLDAVIHDSWAKDEGDVDEVMQTGRDQDSLEEGVNPYTCDTSSGEKALQGGNRRLELRPDDAEQQSYREHEPEAGDDDER